MKHEIVDTLTAKMKQLDDAKSRDIGPLLFHASGFPNGSILPACSRMQPCRFLHLGFVEVGPGLS